MAKAVWTDPALLETLIVFAVAQRPFDHTGEGAVVNTFCTLQPLMQEQGERTRATDFPNNGLVWWKLRAPSRAYAEPGTLVAGYIEQAIQYSPDDYNKQLYQVVPHEIAPIGLQDAVEVYAIADGAIGRPRDLVNTPGLIELDHPPSEMVLVRWRGELYGLFRPSVAASGAGLYRVTLATASPDGGVLRMPDVPAGAGGVVRARVPISLDSRPPFRSSEVREASYELLLPELVVDLQSRASEQLLLLKDDELILRTAKRLLTRAERQRLGEMLERMRDELRANGSAQDVDAAELMEAVRRRSQAAAGSIPDLAQALLETDAMRDPVARAIAQRTQTYIEENAAALAAEVEARIAGERERLEALRHEREDVEAQLDARRREWEREFRERMDEEWRTHSARVEQELGRIADERTRLEERAELLSTRLTQIAGRFGTEHERLVGDLLVLLPVLQRVGAASGSADAQAGSRPPGPADAAATPSDESPVVLPAWIERGTADARGAPTEGEFYDRFVAHAARAPHVYAPHELAAFHVAVKCGDLTLLGGAPGTGRAALTRLYADALAGDAGAGDRFLITPVQVTWLDLQDLVGGVNAHARLFEPANTGVFRWLLHAAAEYEHHGVETGIHLLCLSEIDRGAPEHYLGTLLHALDDMGSRTLRCFDPHAVRPGSAYARWSSLVLPPSLRLVGTLAEDETARAIGHTVRDRANEVRLAGAAARDATIGGGAGGEVTGSPVTLRSYQRWARDAALPSPWSTVLDRLRAPLAELGADLSPRAFRVLSRFVASGGELLSPAAAFDVQVAWRVLPRLAAAVVLRGGETAAAAIEAVLEPHLRELPLSADALARIRERTDDFGSA